MLYDNINNRDKSEVNYDMTNIYIYMYIYIYKYINIYVYIYINIYIYLYIYIIDHITIFYYIVKYLINCTVQICVLLRIKLVVDIDLGVFRNLP